MPTAEEIYARVAKAESEGWAPPGATAQTPQVTAADVFKRVQDAEARGWTPEQGPRRPVLSLKRSPAERALAVGTQSMGAPDPSRTEGWGERVRGAAAAISEPWVETAQGIHQLLGASPEQLSQYEATIQELRRQAPQGGARTAGNVVGEALQYAIPGTAGVGLGRQLLARMPNLAARRGMTTGVPLATEAGAIAGFEAAATPGTPEERATAATMAGAGAVGGGLVGTGLGRAIQKVREGVRASPQVARPEFEGVPTTPGQRSDSEALKWVEENMGFFPGLRGPVGRMQQNAVEAWNRNMLQGTFRNVPESGVSITKSGPEGFQQAQQGFGRLYDDFWERSYNRIGPDALEDFPLQLAEQTGFVAKQKLDDTAAQRVSRYMRDRAQALSKNPTPGTLQKFNRDLQDYAQAARSKGEFVEAEVIEGAVKTLEDSLGDSAQLLRQLNAGYRDLKTLERAASYKKTLGEGYFTPDDLLSSVKARGSERQLAAGTAPLQPEAVAASETLGTLNPRGTRLGQRFATAGMGVGLYNEPTAVMAGLLAGRAAVTEPMRRAMTGQTGWQQWLGKQDLDKLREALTRIGAPTGAALTPQ